MDSQWYSIVFSSANIERIDPARIRTPGFVKQKTDALDLRAGALGKHVEIVGEARNAKTGKYLLVDSQSVIEEK